ncbi:LPXTG cell wall anchor domain-containing protein [Streptomyces sp. JB150]|uniref:LPXTG cell wall anchor domain-containing protein n=1 Tax=Streptomyces sp. JB150 TaxID=2714844 RepID=UPI00140CEFD4|nr:LPXTG cell wall anchor domain-containing protein [Streptomyces sp. JB150]QIJ63277.1 LPXTG cell wall anchor domain-containing protein [Streptomyces sp. JB150]
MRQHTRRAAAVATAVALAAAVPAVLAPTAHAAEAAPDLSVSTLSSLPFEPGDVYEDTVTLTNHGTAPADGVSFQVRLTRGLDFPEPVKGCTYTTDEQSVRTALCELDTVIQPGATFTTPVRFKALPHALMEAVEYGTSRTGEAPSGGFDQAYQRLAMTAGSSADVVAVGDRAEAAPGETVTVRATLRNDGPGWVQDQVSDNLPGLVVRVPAGTVAVEVPADCSTFGVDGPSGPAKPGKSAYVCRPADASLDVDETHTWAFSLKVKEGAKDTKGEVRASSVYDITPKYDKKLANNTAYLRVDVTGDDDSGTSGGSGSAGGSAGASGGGSTNGSTSGSTGGNDPDGQSTGGTGTAGSTGTTGSAGTGGSATGTSGTTGGGTGGNLAATGSDGTPLLAGAAAAAAAVGGLLVLAVRRRRAGAQSS